MKLHSIIFLMVVIVVSFLVFCGTSQGAPGDSIQPVTEVPDQNDVVFPYIAEILGSDINIRSGSGRNYYSCGKISAPAQIVVVDQSYNWSQILPPQGSFSWIFKDYVNIEPDDPTVGVVSNDNVRVYAGSQTREPIRSDSLQVKLDKGQKVRILGPVQNDYYKISPPEGATLWIYTEYAKFVRSADEIEVTVAAKQNIEETKPVELKPVVVPTTTTPASTTPAPTKRQEYYKLAEQVKAESAKPIDEQDYAGAKAALIQIQNDPNSGKVSKYAKYLVKRIERCELAKQAGAELAEQQAELQKALDQIAKDKREKLKTVADEGIYSVVGRINPSAVYDTKIGSKRYLVTDSGGGVICYAQPSTDSINMEDFLGKRVGLIGVISADPKSNLALVEFIKVVVLE